MIAACLKLAPGDPDILRYAFSLTQVAVAGGFAKVSQDQGPGGNERNYVGVAAAVALRRLPPSPAETSYTLSNVGPYFLTSYPKVA